jgi:hypothetical protein
MLDAKRRPLLRGPLVRHAGKVSLGTLLLLALIGGGIYYVVMVAPFYVDHLDVKEAVAAAHNLAGRSHDGVLRAEIIQRTGQMASHVERDSWGIDRVVPGLGLTEEQILIERSGVTENVRIEVSYEREVQFKPFDYVRALRFSAVQEGIPPR